MHTSKELFYNKVELFESIDWIKYNSNIDDIIFSSNNISNILAGRSLRRVYLGHWAETSDSKFKSNQTNKFFYVMDAEQRKKFLEQENIGLVLFDEQWKKNKVFNPDKEKYLEKIFEKGDYKVFKVL